MNRRLDGHLIIVLRTKYVLSKLTVLQIEGDVKNHLPFYSPQLKNALLDLAYKCLRDIPVAVEALGLMEFLEDCSNPEAARVLLSKLPTNLHPYQKVERLLGWSMILEVSNQSLSKFALRCSALSSNKRIAAAREIAHRLGEEWVEAPF